MELCFQKLYGVTHFCNYFSEKISPETSQVYLDSQLGEIFNHKNLRHFVSIMQLYLTEWIRKYRKSSTKITFITTDQI